MTTWNYRLTVETCNDDEIWGVREIYYDDDGDVTTWSTDPVAASGNSWQECADDLSRILSVIVLPAWDLDAKRWCDRKRKPKGDPS